MIGYNGLGRVFGSGDGAPQGMGGGGGFAGGFGGEYGLTRMFDTQAGGQISWLLPLCAVAMVVAVVVAVLHRRGKLPASALLPSSGWLLWGTWLVVCAAVYSSQKGILHPYYTTQLAPAVAALCGGMTAALVRAHRAGLSWAPLAGVAGVAVSVIWAVALIRREPDWNGRLVWPVLLVGCAAVVLLVLSRRHGRLLTVAVGAAVTSVLVAPGAWAVSVPGSTGMGGSNPTAGPQTLGFGGGGGMPRQSGNGGGLPSGMPSGMPTNMRASTAPTRPALASTVAAASASPSPRPSPRAMVAASNSTRPPAAAAPSAWSCPRPAPAGSPADRVREEAPRPRPSGRSQRPAQGGRPRGDGIPQAYRSLPRPVGERRLRGGRCEQCPDGFGGQVS